MKCQDCGKETTINDINTEIFEISYPNVILHCHCDCGNGFFLECIVKHIRKDEI